MLSEQVDALLFDQARDGLHHGLDVRKTTLPELKKDATDRNRTSPFAFTGNKFEFRMLGASMSIAGANTVLNTIVADALCTMADELERAKDFDKAVVKIIRRTVEEHRRIVFSGNGYSDEWMMEAERRGPFSTAFPAHSHPRTARQFSRRLWNPQGSFRAIPDFSIMSSPVHGFLRTFYLGNRCIRHAPDRIRSPLKRIFQDRGNHLSRKNG